MFTVDFMQELLYLSESMNMILSLQYPSTEFDDSFLLWTVDT